MKNLNGMMKVLDLQTLASVEGAGIVAYAWSTTSNSCGTVGSNEWSTGSAGCRTKVQMAE